MSSDLRDRIERLYRDILGSEKINPQGPVVQVGFLIEELAKQAAAEAPNKKIAQEIVDQLKKQGTGMHIADARALVGQFRAAWPRESE